MSKRIGDWIETYTGRKFWPLDPRPAEICIEDIAHALSMQCRFGGHVREFYSVAQHSVMVSSLCPPEDKFWGLMHDAAEAYLVDLPRPIKYGPNMQAYRTAERALMTVICQWFRLPTMMPESVKRADDVMCINEARALMPSQARIWSWGEDIPPLGFDLHPFTPHAAEREFLDYYERLAP